MSADFEPRSAALNHAGLTERATHELLKAAAAQDDGHAITALGAAYADGVHAVACALVYVGDQVRALAAQNEPVDAEVVDQTKVEYADALRRIVDHEEHMGSGPPDDEMRAIARKALEGVEDA